MIQPVISLGISSKFRKILINLRNFSFFPIFRTLTVILIITSFSHFAVAQSNRPDSYQETVQITASAVENVPANQINMMITLRHEHEDVAEAYAIHSRSEQFLAEKIQSLGLKSDQIRYQPVRIHPITQRDGSEMVRTDQTVTLTLNDFELYISLQQLLIEHGFRTFSASFSSDRVDAAAISALEKAVGRARELGEVIAKSAGMELGDIQSIEYGKIPASPYERTPSAAMAMDMSGGLISEFEQTIPVHQTVTIIYYLSASTRTNNER
jgi:uncharacterized protein YggE